MAIQASSQGSGADKAVLEEEVPGYHTAMRAYWTDVDTLLLDMDGTVLDLAFDDDFWTTRLPRAYARRHRLPMREARARLARWFESERGRLSWYCMDWWSRKTGVDLVRLTRRGRARIAVLPGVTEFLETVSEMGLRIWLVTNAHPAALGIKLDYTGMARYFERIVCAHDIGFPKEDLRFWRSLRARHGFSPGNSLLVDDNLDVLATANRFGIGRVVAIRRPNSCRPPQHSGNHPAIDGLANLLPAR